MKLLLEHIFKYIVLKFFILPHHIKLEKIGLWNISHIVLSLSLHVSYFLSGRFHSKGSMLTKNNAPSKLSFAHKYVILPSLNETTQHVFFSLSDRKIFYLLYVRRIYIFLMRSDKIIKQWVPFHSYVFKCTWIIIRIL